MFGINLFDLFRADATRGATDFVDAAIDRLVRMTNPRLRLLDRYRERLRPAAELACAHANGVAQALPAPLDADPARWASSDALRAFFVGRGEIVEVYGGSQELRRLFRREPLIDHAYAILAMYAVEQRVFGVAVEDGELRRDVAQTTLSFARHRVRLCAGSEAGLREAIAWQVIDQLALRTLARLTTLEDRRHELEIDRALLAARLRMLRRECAGFDDCALARGAAARLEAELEHNARELAESGGGTMALERALDVLRATLAEPEVTIRCAIRRELLSPMNVRLTQPGDEPHLAFEFVEARLAGEPATTLAIMPTRYPRQAMPSNAPSMAQKGGMLLP